MFWSGSPFGKQLRDVEVEEVVAAGRAHLTEEPLTRSQLKVLLAARWPDADADSITYAVAYLVPLVQVPPRGLWSRSGRATLTTADSWLGRRVRHSAKPDDAVRRYLAAFGPASMKDIATWSGLTGVREIVERLCAACARSATRTASNSSTCRTHRSPSPTRPRPCASSPEYDNVFLSHADRSRIVDPADRPRFGSWDGRFFRMVLVGGFIRAIWRPEDGDVVVRPVRRLSKKDTAAVQAEGRRLAAFLGGGDVRILPA